MSVRRVMFGPGILLSMAACALAFPVAPDPPAAAPSAKPEQPAATAPTDGQAEDWRSLEGIGSIPMGEPSEQFIEAVNRRSTVRLSEGPAAADAALTEIVGTTFRTWRGSPDTTFLGLPLQAIALSTSRGDGRLAAVVIDFAPSDATKELPGAGSRRTEIANRLVRVLGPASKPAGDGGPLNWRTDRSVVWLDADGELTLISKASSIALIRAVDERQRLLVADALDQKLADLKALVQRDPDALARAKSYGSPLAAWTARDVPVTRLETGSGETLVTFGALRKEDDAIWRVVLLEGRFRTKDGAALGGREWVAYPPISKAVRATVGGDR